ncbi:MAG: rhomboid family intramembrane serine protease [Terriglobales bacterium]
MLPIRDDAPRFATPWVTYLLMTLNLLAFLFEMALPADARNAFISQFGLVPANITRLLSSHETAPDVTLLPLITSMFLHASWLHLIFNMWALWIFGDNIEDYLGHFRYLLLYLLAGVAASGLHFLLNLGSPVPSVGASGAIAGVMGAYLVLYPSARVLTMVPFPVYLPAWLVLGYWFVVQFMGGAATAIAYSSQTTGGVAFWAHVGGFLAGIFLIKLFPTRPRRYRFRTWYG